MKRLHAIEGLRGYLALWVLVCHVLSTIGYEQFQMHGFLLLMREGDLAVDLFVIISGFVILLLLDEKREEYLPFITRRFFRLYPLFIVLFSVSIPISIVESQDIMLERHNGLLTSQRADVIDAIINSGWSHLGENVALHAVMLHGLVPQKWLPNGPLAFLGATWSISLEWQFYLLAPLAFVWATSSRPVWRMTLCAVCGLMFFAARRFLPEVQNGAALPFHIEFFFVGGLSYFIWKNREIYHQAWARGATLSTGITLAFFLYFFSKGSSESTIMIPLSLWLVFLSLNLELPDFWLVEGGLSLFTNSWARFLGTISYSVYLSHALVIWLTQRAVLWCFPVLDRKTDFFVLLGLTVPLTILLSTFLYKYIEIPGMRLGKWVADKFETPSTASVPLVSKTSV